MNRVLYCFFLVIVVTINGSAQTEKAAHRRDTAFDIHRGSFLLPQPLPAWKYSQAISVYYVVPPKDWTLDMVKAPMINYSGKYTLPYNFNFQAGLSTLLVSNRLNFGPFWNIAFDRNYIGIGYQVAFNYGILKQFGFNTVLTGWEQQPSLTLGHRFERTALTIRGDYYYTSTLVFSEGGNDVPIARPFTNGYSVTGTFEQRLIGRRAMSLGLKINYLRYHIIAWPALPVNSYRYVIPEFQIGFNF